MKKVTLSYLIKGGSRPSVVRILADDGKALLLCIPQQKPALASDTGTFLSSVIVF